MDVSVIGWRQGGLALIVIAFVLAGLLLQEHNKKYPVPMSTSMEKQQLKPKDSYQKLVPMVVVSPKAIETKPEVQAKQKKLIKVTEKTATESGLKLLNNKQAPKLQGELKISFSRYLAIIQSKGGQLAIYDRQKKRLVGKLHKGKFETYIPVAGFASRTRDVSNDVPSKLRKNYLQLIENKIGKGAYRFLIMIPQQVEAHFIGLLQHALVQQNIEISELDKVSFSYVKQAQNILLQINKVEQQGKVININASVVW